MDNNIISYSVLLIRNYKHDKSGVKDEGKKSKIGMGCVKIMYKKCVMSYSVIVKG